MKITIVAVKGTSLYYGRREVAAGMLFLLEPLIQRRESSTCKFHVGRVVLCYSVYCAYYGVYYVQYNIETYF